VLSPADRAGSEVRIPSLVSRSPLRNVLVLLGYLAISFAYFGWRLLPHPGEALVGSKHDPQIFVWSFAWWPHAIGNWTNPFFTHALYAPEGINLAWTTSVLGLALAFAPVTLLFGPIVAYNLAALMLPALAAWTAYLLCRYVTGSTWASLVGGYLFGFSSYVLGQQLQGHLHMTGVFLLPLVALALLRYVDGNLGPGGLAWRLGVILALQLSISTEIALTMTVALAVGLALAAWRVKEARGRLRSALAPIAAGYGLGALLAAPLLAYAALDIPWRSFAGAETAGTDALNLVFPTSVNGLAGSSFDSLTDHFNATESALYFGLPTLLMVLLYAWRRRRSRGTQFLVAGFLAGILLALGPALRIDGREIVTLPWTLAHHVPALENARLPRFAVYAALAASVVVALWIATTRGRIYPRPFVLPVLAVAALVPAVTQSLYVKDPERPRFFADGLYSRCIPRGESLAIFPYGGDSMLWQAETGFRFRLAGGYLYPTGIRGPVLTKFDEDPTVMTLRFRTDVSLPTMDNLLGFAGRKGVDRIVTAASSEYPSARQMKRFGPVQRVGDVLVAPACGAPSLATRDLSPVVDEIAAQARSGSTISYCHNTYYYQLPVDVYPAGVLAGATRAKFVDGVGLTCEPPPPGYQRQGYAPEELGVPANTYPYYTP
jgi:hypothetical protein